MNYFDTWQLEIKPNRLIPKALCDHHCRSLLKTATLIQSRLQITILLQQLKITQSNGRRVFRKGGFSIQNENVVNAMVIIYRVRKKVPFCF